MILADINCAVNSNSWVGLYKISYLRNVSIYFKETSQKSLKHLSLCVCQILFNLVQVCSFYCNMLSDRTFIWTHCIYISIICHLRFEVDHHEPPLISIFRCPFQFSIRFHSCPIYHILYPCIPCATLFLTPSAFRCRICKCAVPAVPLNTCSAYFILRLIISFRKCNSVCNPLSSSLFVILSL